MSILRKLGLFIFLALLACNSENQKAASGPEGHDDITEKKVFLIGHGPNSKEVIKELVNVSGLRKEGYIVILPSRFEKSDSSVYYLKHEFNEQHINAVHSLELKKGTKIQRTDILAIENASLICIMDGGKKGLIRFARDSILHNALHNAYNNGATIAGYGAGASVLAEKLFIENKNYNQEIEEGNITAEKYKLVNGLGIVKNVIIENFDFLQNNKQKVEETIQKLNIPFIEIGPLTTLKLTNNNAFVTGRYQYKVILLKPASENLATKPIEGIYSDGDTFDVNMIDN